MLWLWFVDVARWEIKRKVKAQRVPQMYQITCLSAPDGLLVGVTMYLMDHSPLQLCKYGQERLSSLCFFFLFSHAPNPRSLKDCVIDLITITGNFWKSISAVLGDIYLYFQHQARMTTTLYNSQRRCLPEVFFSLEESSIYLRRAIGATLCSTWIGISTPGLVQW